VTARKVGRALVRNADIVVRAGAPTTLDFAMFAATELDQVVVTASRAPEKVVDAPASVSVVPPEVVAARPALTSTDHIKGQPGVDISNGGLLQANVVARGFNNIFSGALMTLTDNRFASVPSLAVNVPYLVPITNEDIERIEIVLGPGAALYGPNTANGVMNIITKSPFESPGASITAGGGIAASSGSSDVNIYRTALRYAAKVNEKVAFKVSGEYTGGKDWQFHDPAEPPATPRDFALKRYAGEARLDIRPMAGTEWVTSYGRVTAGRAIELTGSSGAAQVKDWTYQSVQSRLRSGRLFAQVFGNFSDAGETVVEGKLPGSWPKLTTRPDVLLRGGERVGSLEVIPAPGHSPGHVAYLDPRDRALIAGDVYTTYGSAAVTNHFYLRFPFAAMATWDRSKDLDSARALRDLDPAVLAVGHGPSQADPRRAMDRAIARAS